MFRILSLFGHKTFPGKSTFWMVENINIFSLIIKPNCQDIKEKEIKNLMQFLDREPTAKFV